MNSKRALLMLMVNQKKVRDGFKLVDLNTNEKVSIEECYCIVMEDLEKLEKENKELKEKVNHFEKVIEVMQNPSKLDCTHMFDNCKELKSLTEKKEHKMTSKEGLKLLETRCRFFAQDEDELQETYEAREAIQKDLELLEILKKHYNVNSLMISLDSFISISIYKTDKDFEKIKEWLDE